MKKLFSLLLLFCSIGLSQSDNIDVTLSGLKYCSVTLVGTIDTADVRYGPTNQYGSYTLTVYSDATDSLSVWTKSWNSVKWTKQAVVNLSTLSSATATEGIIASTTSTEYAIADSNPYSIRITKNSLDASSTVVIVTGKGR